MIFSYYNRLNSAQKSVYRKSDGLNSVELPNAQELRPLIVELAPALKQGDRVRTQQLCRTLATGMASGLNAPPVRVRILAARPCESWGELHGLYVPIDGRASALITLWMRTARRRQVVAFRSFLRTLLHEMCHHFDYELFGLEESYHTQGFYRRESSLFHQLVPDDNSEATRPMGNRAGQK